MTRERGPRGPGFVYSTLAIALVGVLAAVALTTRQPPPPTIAEFAPQAVEQIEDAPNEQSSEFGAGEGVGAAAAERAEEAKALGLEPPRPPVVDVPRVRRCVGDPPRQTEDPQSPPCVPYWEGDNGGETWQGVTRDEIRVMIPTEADRKNSFFEHLRVFFNRRFEFYGRKLVFVYDQSGAGSSPPENQNAAAQKADEQEKVFASHFYRGSGGFFYHRELARRGVPSVVGPLLVHEHKHLASARPYLWQYPMGAEEMFANWGEWACGRLAGRPADHAGTGTRGQRRVFGIVMQTYYDTDTTDTGGLETELARCGHRVPPERKVRNGVRQNQGGEATQPAAVDPVTSTNVILQMKGEGVTTIFCPCNLFTAGALMKAATNQGYFPEWVVTSYGPMDFNCAVTLGGSPPDQTEHLIGVTFQPRQIPAEDEPFWQAMKEADPASSPPRDGCGVANRNEHYRGLLVLASGIQMAGPRLTPETFEQGLHRAVFPNPEHPLRAGDLGFNGRRYSATRDGAEFWWKNGDGSPYQGDAGTVCYLDGGRRYSKGSWPKGAGAFFEGPCDSGAR